MEDDIESIKSTSFSPTNTSTPSPARKKSPSEEEERRKAERQHQLKTKYAAENLMNLFIPISFCMIFVIFIEIFVKPRLQERIKVFLIAPYTTPTSVGQVAINVSCILGAIIVMTFLLVLCVKFNLKFLFYGLMSFVLFTVMFLMSFITVLDVVNGFNLTFDWISTCFSLYNFGSVGLISLFGSFPDIMRQFYTCIMCCLIVIAYIDHMHEFTVFALLAVLILWDIFAVLTPCGPLNLLVKMLREKDHIKNTVPPGLIYSTMVYFMADKPKAKSKKTTETKKEEEEEYEKEDEGDHGVHLGLGDFIFYSLLIGKAADYRLNIGVITGDTDWNTILACYVVILIGLIGTVLFLLIFNRALPALPISLALGLIFYFAVVFMVSPFCTKLTLQIAFM